MKKTIILAGCIFLSLALNAQDICGVTHSGHQTRQKPFPIENYKELDNPVKTDAGLWKNIKGIKVSWGSTDIRYKKEVPAMKGKDMSRNVTAWKGERVSSQFVVWGSNGINNLNFTVSDLKGKGDNKIGKNNVFAGFVRYVMTDELNEDKRGGCGYRQDLSKFDSTLVADPIDHLTKDIKLERMTSQGCWVRVDVPRNTPTGSYSGKVIVKDGDKVISTLRLNIKVSERVLPEPQQRRFHLDLWQNPFAVARYHQVGPWSEEHMKALKPYMELYRDAGGKVITTSIIHKPWNGQTHDPFTSMVNWIKKIDGSWEFDYTIFDRWVEFMIDLGIDKQINCYSMVPWKLSFNYFDEASNITRTIDAKPGEKAYEELWTTMLQSFSKHLREKGWFDKTYISMDERPMDVMLETIKVIRKSDPEFKISLAGALHEELIDELDDYCVALRMKYTDEMLAKRKAEGKTTTFYTSCEEPFPNTFTFAAPADAEWFGWYAAKANLDGYLRWALNSWVLEPLLDSRFHTWAAGDTYLIYPGGRTSIRFERLNEGIQAYEKINILRDEYKNNTKALKDIETALEVIDENTLDKTTSAEEIDKAKRILRDLGF